MVSTTTVPANQAADKVLANESKDSIFKVAIVGAGGINFGSPEGPWNNAQRIEQNLGQRLRVNALINPIPNETNRVLDSKRDSNVSYAYNETKMYTSMTEYLDYLSRHPEDEPNAFVIGIPPDFHGSNKVGADMELQIVRQFPNAALFIEKPITSAAVEDAFDVVRQLEQHQAIISIGYMFRYLKVVEAAKKYIQDNNLNIVCTIARYNSSYIHNSKVFWWYVSKSGGPVVEQGTHFCDLSRYFGGDVDISTVKVNRVLSSDPCGKLSALPIDEGSIPEHERVPRFTAASWKYKSGAVGILAHSIILQGTQYDTCLELQADGHYIRIVDLYGTPRLYIRSPESDTERIVNFPDDDPYFSEFEAFIGVAEGKLPRERILSDFEDGTKTYELTKAITNN
ncbi:NAD binding dehydrogenase [Schizosaccharomyces cryophilus OY26]|uniref:NAD binding dehydrogenase n=1 Tax=Schizosaccharomyces cryophilus (strain OY26 / ATCC MYA-4695 / CBS 11777 / NBRC 106824 / NRRL Y48691) TaxID=653667 RepID=S9XCV2_SCHCR|nr:NAD binding dehydrogenase [Schizosaccharomyces cryophilus OY26]EPY51671.1 NAD binding dehydrogenase [Schizosaccharomyces cryophilus OY26]